MKSKKEEFLELINEAISDDSFVSLHLMNRKKLNTDTKKVSIRPVLLKVGKRLSFVYRNLTNDITKNYKADESIEIIASLLESHFAQAELLCHRKNWYLSYPEKGKNTLKEKSAQNLAKADNAHDHQKQRAIPKDRPYLFPLGISNAEGAILKNKQAKYRQINKFIEIVDPIIKRNQWSEEISVVDMGSGKAYLSFALYDHLDKSLDVSVQVKGVEIRNDLVKKCNGIAKDLAYDGLNFLEGSIENVSLDALDVLIALHACNTATDDAIAAGLSANAKIIICSPCCHKQIRKQMKVQNEIQSIVQFGILKERQAEIITDTIRALLMKAHGYKTNVMEFISSEHTAKNLLIVGEKTQEVDTPIQKYLDEIEVLKKTFGIEYHHLEKLLKLHT